MTSVFLSDCFPFNQTREPMTKTQALEVLAEAAKHAKGVVPVEEAKRVLDSTSPDPGGGA